MRFENWEYDIREGASGPFACICSYGGDDAEIAVPDVVDGLPVAEVGDRCFYRAQRLAVLRLPDTVSRIGERAFGCCPRLKEVRLSDAVRELHPLTFTQCFALERVHLPAALRVIPSKLFEDCPLVELHIPRDLVELQDHSLRAEFIRSVVVDEGNACFSTDGLALYTVDGARLIGLVANARSYEVAPGCRCIGHSAFRNKTRLVQVTLPEGLERIEPYAFFRTSVETVDLPSTLRRIDERAFFTCERLRDVALPEGLEMLGSHAFEYTKLSHVVLPASLRRVGRCVFEHSCIDFDDPDGVRIDPSNEHLFSDGTGLYQRVDGELCLVNVVRDVSSYTVREGTTTIGHKAFEKRERIEEVELPGSVTCIGDRAFFACSSLRHMDIPDSVERIGESALWGTSLESVHIGPRVSSMGDAALAVFGHVWEKGGGRTLESLTVDPANSRFYIEENILCERRDGGDVALLFVEPRLRVRIPRAVTRIADMAFCAAHVEELWFHAGLEHVEATAFSNMTGLRRVHLELSRPAGAAASVAVEFPDADPLPKWYVLPLRFADDGEFFDFDQYDMWVTRMDDPVEMLRLVTARLDAPVKLSDQRREQFDAAVQRVLPQVVTTLARHRRMRALDSLADHGFLREDNVDVVIDALAAARLSEAVGYVMELKMRRFGVREEDFSL